jgi:hypothetical protein
MSQSSCAPQQQQQQQRQDDGSRERRANCEEEREICWVGGAPTTQLLGTCSVGFDHPQVLTQPIARTSGFWPQRRRRRDGIGGTTPAGRRRPYGCVQRARHRRLVDQTRSTSTSSSTRRPDSLDEHAVVDSSTRLAQRACRHMDSLDEHVLA